MYDINFFEPYVDNKKSRSGLQKGIFIGVLVVVTLIFGYALFNTVMIPRIRSEIERMSSELDADQIEEKKRKIAQMQETLGELMKQEETVEHIEKELRKRDNLGGYLVETVTNSMPGNVFLKSININQSTIGISSTARTKEDIAQLESNLRQVSYFEDAFIPSITSDENFYNFNVNLRLLSYDPSTDIEDEEEVEEGEETEEGDEIEEGVDTSDETE